MRGMWLLGKQCFRLPRDIYMRILADENIAGIVVRHLRALRYDVRWITEGDAGVDDQRVWEIAKLDARFLITADKIFAGAVTRKDDQKNPGVMLLRLAEMSPKDMADRVAKVIASETEWFSKYCIVSVDGIRLRNI
jgi:predicted nuclease of predicted toxin-antitoxin system